MTAGRALVLLGCAGFTSWCVARTPDPPPPQPAPVPVHQQHQRWRPPPKPPPYGGFAKPVLVSSFGETPAQAGGATVSSTSTASVPSLAKLKASGVVTKCLKREITQATCQTDGLPYG